MYNIEWMFSPGLHVQADLLTAAHLINRRGSASLVLTASLPHQQKMVGRQNGNLERDSASSFLGSDMLMIYDRRRRKGVSCVLVGTLKVLTASAVVKRSQSADCSSLQPSKNPDPARSDHSSCCFVRDPPTSMICRRRKRRGPQTHLTACCRLSPGTEA